MAETGQSFNTERRYCSNCGEPLEPASNFCGRCGEEALATNTGARILGQRTVGPDGVEYAGFGVRLAAAIIDGTITGVVGTIIDLVAGTAILGSLFSLLYYVLLTGLKGQTLGKMALSIQVVDSQGNPPGIWRAILRETIGKLISTIVMFLGFLWIIWDRHRRGWHDHIGGTYVVRKQRDRTSSI